MATNPKRGRRPKATDARRERILEYLRAGYTRTASAEASGVRRETLWDWMRKSPTFSNQVLEAEARAENRWAAVVIQAAEEGDAKFALALLERRRREDWKLESNLKVSGDAENPLAVTVAFGSRVEKLYSMDGKSSMHDAHTNGHSPAETLDPQEVLETAETEV